MSVLVEPSKDGFEPGRSLDQFLDRDADVAKEDLNLWDRGVFLNELRKQGIVLSAGGTGVKNGLVADTGLKEGTYFGTRLALTEYYSLLEQSAVAHMDVKRVEPIIPINRDLELKQSLYQWSDGQDGYPPHLAVLPSEEEQGHGRVGWIFDYDKLQDVSALVQALAFIIPDSIEQKGTPFEGPTIADCEQYNNDHQGAPTDIMLGQNLGNLPDWYSDARFAQQSLSGVNPNTIKKASPEMVTAYAGEASKQGLADMQNLLSGDKDIFVQDYSFFREATHLSNDDSFKNIIGELGSNGKPTGKVTFRYACAPVVIYQLNEDGRLHPLAITIDYKGSLDKSITIFNRRLTPDAKGPVDEKDDWPWRYAKTCAQTADWATHEVAVHLVNTHMIEEAIIVATNRTIPEGQLLYELLSPHWYRTLALNAAARKTLVPVAIDRLAGLGPLWNPMAPQNSRSFQLIRWSYDNFNFQENYVPNDLKKRGWDLEADSGEQYRNYPYATGITLVWEAIRSFVKKVLETKYKSDGDVQRDIYIAPWCKEIQTSGKIPTFPTVTTVDQLIDAVTMCIHIASPQHTAVNYLQNYYYNFVPAKPPALCTPLPKDLKELQSYTEKELTAALPIGTDKENPKWKDWLLAAQLPELLSFKAQGDYTLYTYATSLYNVNKGRTITENKEFDGKAIAAAAADFYQDLKNLALALEYISASQTPGTVKYTVLQPKETAVSILI